MLVRYRMSKKVKVVQPQHTLAETRALLDRHRIRQLPVMRSKALVGIVTDRDLRSAPKAARTVQDVMTAKLFTASPDMPVDEAARILRQHKVNSLPVVEKNNLVGILTTSDVLDAFVDLSGVAEPTFLLMLEAGKRSDREIRQVIERTPAEVKWIGRDRQKPGRAHVRLKARRIDDIVDALEGAGFEVCSMVVPPRRGM